MATLTNKTIASTYTSLLKLEGDTGSTVAGNNSNAVQVKTGDNDATPLYVNTNAVTIGTATTDTSVVNYLAIANGTEPSAHTDNQIYIGAKDASTTSESTLAIFCEEDPIAHDSGGSFTSTHKMKIWLNGTEYWIVLDAV